MNTRRLFALFALLLTVAGSVLLSCRKDDPDGGQPTASSVALVLHNVAGSKAVALDGTTYTTASGETFTISTLEYYISNVVFTKTDGSTYAAPGVYHLVDAARPSTATLTIDNVPTGSYAGLRFTVGVDSTMTKADPLSLTGDLNPANNMYWAWATGHIFMKLEGNVTSASNKPLTCHIGGYRAPYSAIVTAAPSLGGTLPVQAGHTAQVDLTADVLKLFDGTTHFTLSSFPTTMAPSASSVQVAQNYAAGMFTVRSLTAN